jgi:nucleotide-binding universal stress UspA family protein
MAWPEHILVPLDLSPAGLNAIKHAAMLAALAQARVTLLHAVEPLDVPIAAWPEARSYAQKQGQARARRLDGFRQALPPQIRCQTVTVQAPPVQAIREQVALQGVDLVVMTRRGYHGAAGTKIGATTRKLLHHAPVPALVVPAGAQPDPSRYEVVLTPVDLSEASGRALTCALALRATCGAVRIVPTYVIGLARYQPPPGDDGLESLGKPEAEALKRCAEGELARWLADRAPGVEGQVVVAAGPALGILERSRDLPADLIVITSAGRGAIQRFLFGSTADRVVRLAEIPVLVVPAEPVP